MFKETKILRRRQSWRLRLAISVVILLVFCGKINAIEFSEEEQAYLENNNVVRIAAEISNYPVCFYNPYENQWQGIAIDLLGAVEKITGLSFKIANDKDATWTVLLNMLESGEVSMLSELLRSEEREGNFLWSETSMITDNSALLSKSSFPNISINDVYNVKVGVVKNTAHAELFYSRFPSHKYIFEYDNPSYVFHALEKNEIDMMMSRINHLYALTHYQEYVGYKANIIFDNTFKSNFGFNKDEAVLRSIVDKALAQIDTKLISEQWSHKTYDYRKKLLQAQRPWLTGALVMSLCVLILLFILFQRRASEKKRLERLVAKRTEEFELETSKLMAIFDTSPDFIFCKDLESRYTRCSKSIEKYFGISEKDIIGKTDTEAFNFAEKTAEDFIGEDRKVINEKKPFVFEEHIMKQSGDEKGVLVETIKSPIFHNGEVIGIMGISRDVTRRKAAEEAAQAASRSKSTFLANMSHEIRTPMNSIIGFSELAMDGEIPERTKEYLSKILENSEWLLQIINDILDISKIESGKMELETISFDLHEIFAACRTLIAPKAEEKGIALHFYAEPPVGKKLLGDPTRLRQVIINILSNAVKFTNTGSVKIAATVKGKPNGNITISFVIKDTGIGMTAEQTARIFEPFMQAEVSTTRKYGGSGLGLTITKSIINLMGGTLSVESMPGLGSKFSFDLTFKTIDVPERDRPIKVKQIEKPVFEGEVLLCDDNKMNQQLICEHFARVGLKTVVAGNGKEGVEAVRRRMESGEKRFDLIFMDIHMPVMDGLEATVEIIKLDTGTPIIAMTANVMSDNREQYITNGMEDCVSKPFTSQELWNCLLRHLTPVNASN
ncbi:MAG: transporter substrate-binding domain-containing protein [Treponema sp.]|jgi:PAS domain S-box-containing protein|nr:transporter substrate-binding domain-containing protein [Treponema sp.]